MLEGCTGRGFLRRSAMFCGALAAGLLAAGGAAADATHVVARGHTLESIANRYHVAAKDIIAANKLKNPGKLKPGDTLVIPGVKDTAKKDGKDGRAAGANAKAGTGKPGDLKDAKKKPATYAMKPKHPGLVHLARLATSEESKVRLVDRRGKTVAQSAKAVEKLLRSAQGSAHSIEPRLLALLAIVSDHFGGRKIEVISGYRPYQPTQHTAHSNHNVGRAIDFRVVGVPNEVVRDFCKTLRNVGVGYYPNSTFVHLDARTTSAFWIDYSRPGEPPRYADPNVEADEGTSDVSSDVLSGGTGESPTANTPPSETKSDAKGAAADKPDEKVDTKTETASEKTDKPATEKVEKPSDKPSEKSEPASSTKSEPTKADAPKGESKPAP